MTTYEDDPNRTGRGCLISVIIGAIMWIIIIIGLILILSY